MLRLTFRSCIFQQHSIRQPAISFRVGSRTPLHTPLPPSPPFDDTGSMMSKIRKRMSGMGVSNDKNTAEAASSPAVTTAAVTPGQSVSTQPASNGPSSTAAANQDSTINNPEAHPAATDFPEGTTTEKTNAENTSAAAPADEDNTTSSTPINHNYTAKGGLRTIYPALDALRTGMLAVDDEHSLYWEVSGNPDGVPVIFLHGGPGGGCTTGDRRWFDPQHYCIYILDQRGSGRSTPHASLNNNTTWDLVADVEKLREHVKAPSWHVFGGSWGSCLALAYAEKHPDRVLSLVLRGIFTLRRSELLFFYQEGTSHIFPDYFEPYRNFIPSNERDDLMQAYYKRLTGTDESAQLEAAKQWSTWECATSKLYIDEEHVRRGEDAKWALAFARIECHFFVNRGWMEDGQLLFKENVDKIRHIPAVIVQGRYDCVCPAETAFDLHKEWPEADFHIVPDSGHGSREIGIAHQLTLATDKMRNIKP